MANPENDKVEVFRAVLDYEFREETLPDGLPTAVSFTCIVDEDNNLIDIIDQDMD